MRKTALTITVTTLVLGVFGAFFRWLQLMNAFDSETGLRIPGALTSILLLVYCFLAAAALCLLTLLWLGRYDSGREAAVALRCSTVLPRILGWLLCAAFAAASFVVLFTAASTSYPMLHRLFGAFGILAALSIPFLFGKKGSSGAGSTGRTTAVVISLFYCMWMVVSYKNTASDPILWNYALQSLALAASGVGLYHVTAFYFGAGKVTPALIALQLGAFFSIAVIFEKRSTELSVMFIVSAALQLLLEFLLIENMWEKRDEI